MPNVKKCGVITSFKPVYLALAQKCQIFVNKIHSSSLPVDIIEVIEPIDWDDVERVLKPKYGERLKKLSERKKGTASSLAPDFFDLLYRTRLSCKGTYLAMKEVMAGNYKFGFNCFGGAHHAGPGFWEAEVEINDIAVGINKIRAEGISSRIAILDFDYHPGDGTIAHFGGDKSVFTASIHEGGWRGGESDNEGWGEGFGTNLSYEVKTPISGVEYLRIVEEEIIPRAREFNPELIIFLNGVDTHKNDPVTSKYLRKAISLSDDNYAVLADLIAEFALEVCEGKIVGLGTGGYAPKIAANIYFQTVQRFTSKLC